MLDSLHTPCRTSRSQSRGSLRAALALCALCTSIALACRDDPPPKPQACDTQALDPLGNPVLAPECVEEPPPPDCSDEPTAPGCPCLTGDSRACFAGPQASVGVGPCRAGYQRCISRIWRECEDEVAPSLEQCNGEDDDCDGLIDERVQSPCGGCDGSCAGAVWGSQALPFSARAEDGWSLTERGELTLLRRARQHPSVWVPNTGEASVSKLDAGRATEIARYRVAPDADRLLAERVAVDPSGDAFVLSSAQRGRSSLVKIAGARQRCIDRDQAGLVTSSGPDELFSFGHDECVLFERAVGDDGGMARSLSVDATLGLDEPPRVRVFVGLANEQRLLELDGERGELVRAIELPGFSPHASSFDPWGSLWLIDRAGVLARVPTWQAEPVVERFELDLACYALEAIASDAQGTLLLTGFSCENIARFDPVSLRVDELQAPLVQTTRGVAVLGEEAWVVHTSGELSRIGRDPFALRESFTLERLGFSPYESIAIGSDARGQLWVVSSMGGPSGVGLATRFSPAAGEVTAQVPVGRLPRGQGDLTGNALSELVQPQARTRRVFEGCHAERVGDGGVTAAPSTEWQRVHVDWQPAPLATLLLEARHAPARDQLDSARFMPLGELPRDTAPLPLALPRGGVVELRLTLRAGSLSSAPRVARIGLQWSCPGPD